ncbi:GIY-YIG nuclease family protein [Neobacillus sp. YIM B06451]|uniref:GIY-YIG nuclease family protein n=1 Tax=Neobacillus sp. YIM B06451 TaxID=3070994 RepID=UPI00292E4BEE|nr:GIY-YIG nuclease family protein [Neobacillus sp. YIM B06451]
MNVETANEIARILINEFEAKMDFIFTDLEDENDKLNRLIYLHVNLFGKDSDERANVIALYLVIEKLFDDIELDAQELLSKVTAYKLASERYNENKEEKQETTHSEFESGYIYVLINPSLQGMVKIGKTKRDPAQRVDELSSATGIPTPFTLVYKEFFDDCSKAEKMIHGLLEQEGYRVSKNREFFDISIHESIKLIQSVAQNVNNHNFAGLSETNYETTSQNTLAEELYEKAETYYYGYDDEFEDYEKALQYFIKAADLGHAYSAWHVAIMHNLGEGCKKNPRIALEYYKKAATLGLNDSFVSMAEIYGDTESGLFSMNNALKCWKNYFEKYDFVYSPDTSKLSNINTGVHLEKYVEFCLDNDITIQYLDILTEYKQLIIDAIDKKISVFENHGLDDYVDKFENEKIYVRNNL